MAIKPFKAIQEIGTLSRQDIERASTRFAKSFYMGDHLVLCKLLTKYKMYVDARDVSVAPNILMDGFWESWITKFIAKTIQPGDICIDAGANFGYYSLIMGELAGAEGKAIAIEPNAYLCKLLSFTKLLNGYHFEIVQKALSNQKGEVLLTIPTHLWGDATIGRRKVDGEVMTEVVQVDTLDRIAVDMGLTRIDFIKIDCEGMEPQIFEGMTKTLEQNPQLKIVMEYSPFMYSNAKDFTEFLFSRFEVGEVTGDSTIRKYTEGDIPYLLHLTTHIDLFLEQKSVDSNGYLDYVI
jgi:FkbM family methyltransferase